MSERFCTFYLDEFLFGVRVDDVQEIIRSQSVTPFPLTDKVVRGLINLRGQIVMAIDLRLRLDLAPKESDNHMNVIVKSTDGPVSLLVDRIGDVVEVHEDIYEPPPPILRGVARNLINGAYKLSDRLLMSLDMGRVLDWKNEFQESNLAPNTHTHIIQGKTI
ncbi:chemotaxis protein CheW [Kamptonema cortianum]|nr:chemotaxis protein CheW [Oscillatoria laete-virens]MDK3161844.1 chemotaxis protein CheW [Kamptonema cortianum]MDL5054414.1 chemotaxis protein CheW [Oscillatoria laete-virens NRMC-F 0139]